MPPLPPDPYVILGVAKTAQLPEIRSSYRKLVLTCHPDKVHDPALKTEKQNEFQRVQQAYELLSDEQERTKYDDRVKLMELQQKRNVEANTSVPRTSPKYYEVRTAEPRPDSFRTRTSSSRTPPTASAKMYAQHAHATRSREDEVHDTPPSRVHEEAPRSARRQASYESKPSRREGEKERERNRRRRKEDAEEREKLNRALEREAKEAKDARRAEKKRLEKQQEKERRAEAEEKRKHFQPYVEAHDGDDYRILKSERKKSSRKTEDVARAERAEKAERERTRSVAREEDPAALDKTQMDMLYAVRYMTSARQKGQPSLGRSQTYHESSSYSLRYASPPAAVPTPPPAQDSPYHQPPPPPPPHVSAEEEDVDIPRRSSAKSASRRSSDTPKAKDKLSHKKSSSGGAGGGAVPKDHIQASNPIIIDTGSAARLPPQFAKASTTPPMVPESPPRKSHLSRSNTMKEDYPPRQVPQPSISRAQTYHYAGEPDPRTVDPRGRSRSRLQAQVVSEESESEDEHERERRYRPEPRRRDRRHRTHSPEPVLPDYPSPPSSSRHGTTRYAVNNGRTVPIPAEQVFVYREESPPPRKSSKASYYPPTAHGRPSMPPRDADYSSSGNMYFPKVKTAKSYTPDDVSYGNIPHSGYREEGYAWA